MSREVRHSPFDCQDTDWMPARLGQAGLGD